MSDLDKMFWWQRKAVLAALIVASALPLLWPPLPPLTDLPGHVARWHIAAAASGSPLERYFRIEWAPIGNLGTDLPGVLLTPLIGALAAGKTIMIGVVMLTVAAMLWLAREAHGRVPPTAIAALPLAFAWPFQLGFANFVLAQALAIASLALWLRMSGRAALRAAIFAPVGMAIWTAHSAGWGLFGMMAFGAELAALRGRGCNWPRSIARSLTACLPLALPILVMLAKAPTSGRGADTGDWFDLSAKLIWSISVLRDRWQWFDLASLGLLLLLLYVAVRSRIGFDPRIGAAALSCLVAFLLLPRLLMGGAYVDMRALPLAWILILLAIRPPAERRFASGLAFIALAFFAIRTGATMLSFIQRAAEQRTELGALAAIPRGSAVLSLVSRPCLTPWDDRRDQHLPAYAIIARDAFTNEQWMIAGQQYLAVRLGRRHGFDSDPTQLVYPAGCPVRALSLDRALAIFPRAAFDHVWLIGHRLSRPHEMGLIERWTNGRSALYQVAGKAVPVQVERRRETGAGERAGS